MIFFAVAKYIYMKKKKIFILQNINIKFNVDHGNSKHTVI